MTRTAIGCRAPHLAQPLDTAGSRTVRPTSRIRSGHRGSRRAPPGGDRRASTRPTTPHVLARQEPPKDDAVAGEEAPRGSFYGGARGRRPRAAPGCPSPGECCRAIAHHARPGACTSSRAGRRSRPRRQGRPRRGHHAERVRCVEPRHRAQIVEELAPRGRSASSTLRAFDGSRSLSLLGALSGRAERLPRLVVFAQEERDGSRWRHRGVRQFCRPGERRAQAISPVRQRRSSSDGS